MLQFVGGSDGHLYRYDYVAAEEPIVKRHWAGLFEDWDTWGRSRTPFTEFAVNNSNTEEVAVYLGLAWRLTTGLRRYAIPCHYRDDVARDLGRPPELVDWEYYIEAREREPRKRDNGFVHARAARPPMRAGLFGIDRFVDLIVMVRTTLCDASAEVSVFGVSPDDESKGRLVQSLATGRPRPQLQSGLGSADMFVDITIACDLGYYDSIIVASRIDLGERLRVLCADYARRISDYESRVDTISDVEAFCAAMRELTGVEGSGSAQVFG